MYDGCVPRMVICKYRAFLTCMLDVFLAWLDVGVGHSFLTWMLDVFLPWSHISAEEDEDLHGGYAYNQHEKGISLYKFVGQVKLRYSTS